MSKNALTAEAMKQVEQRWAKAKGTASRMAIYADDAMLDDLDARLVVGKRAIQAFYEEREEAGERAAVENREAVIMGSWGYTSGTWLVYKPDGRVNRGTYLNVIKLVGGEAKMFRQIFEVTERS